MFCTLRLVAITGMPNKKNVCPMQTELSLLSTIFQNTDSLSFSGLFIKSLYALKIIDFL